MKTREKIEKRIEDYFDNLTEPINPDYIKDFVVELVSSMKIYEKSGLSKDDIYKATRSIANRFSDRHLNCLVIVPNEVRKAPLHEMLAEEIIDRLK